jgi:hypothetical protein
MMILVSTLIMVFTPFSCVMHQHLFLEPGRSV